MKNVVIHRSQLLAIVEDDRVFVRPLAVATRDLTPEERADDQRIRYEAWNACEYIIGGACVFAGTCEGRRVYVVLDKRVYDASRYPVPVLTKDADDNRRFQEEQAAKKQAKREQVMKHREVTRSRYEIIPKQHNGVNYGSEQRVLIRTQTHVLTWKPGSASYLDRGSGQNYSRGEFCVMPYEKTDGTIAPCNHDGAHPLGYRCIFAGEGSQDIPAPHGFRMSPKNLIAMLSTFESALELESGTLKVSNWTGGKTLVL